MSETTLCANHETDVAYWRCLACDKTLCGECVKAYAIVAGDGFATCRACGGKCDRVSVLGGVEAERAAKRAAADKPFEDRLTDMWRFPWHGESWVMLTVGAGTIWVLYLIGIVFLPIAILLGAGFSVFLTVYSVKVISDSASGEVEAGDWPDVRSLWDDLAKPFLLVVGTGIICYLPAWLRSDAVNDEGIDGVYTVLFLLGSIYYPMALISVVLDESLAGLNPVRVVPAIVATWRDYWIVCVTMVVMAGVPDWGGWLAANVPIVGALIGGVSSMYLLMFQSHLLGSLYHANRRVIGWYADDDRLPAVVERGSRNEAVEVVDGSVGARGFGGDTAEGDDDEILDLADVAESEEGR